MGRVADGSGQRDLAAFLGGADSLQVSFAKRGAPLQQIVGGNAGVKFGNNVVVTAQATADTAQNAQNLAGMLQLLTNMAKLQAAGFGKP